MHKRQHVLRTCSTTRRAVQPSVIEQASKCGSLMHMLQTAGLAVISSSFPAVLDICAALLAPRGIRFVQIDVGTSTEAATRAAAAFAAGNVAVVLLQHQAALQLPSLDLSRADLCIFYDSGINRAVRSPPPYSPRSSVLVTCLHGLRMRCSEAIVLQTAALSCGVPGYTILLWRGRRCCCCAMSLLANDAYVCVGVPCGSAGVPGQGSISCGNFWVILEKHAVKWCSS